MPTRYPPKDLLERVRRDVAADGLHLECQHLTGSSQSSCYTVVVGASGPRARQYVLKCFRPARGVDAAAAARTEYAALGAFSTALASAAPGVVCPAPLALYADHASYLMSLFAGRTLDDLLATGANVDDAVPVHIARGIAHYYAALGEPYDDFQPQNVLIGEQGEVCLIDPTLPAPLRVTHNGVSVPFGTSDMGFWAHVECTKAFKRSLLRPGENPRRLAFANRLMRAMADELMPGCRSDFIELVFEVADRHARRLRATQPLRTFPATRASLRYAARLRAMTTSWI